MIEFLIETSNGLIQHDFSFHLVKAIDYQQWYSNHKEFTFKLIEAKEAKIERTKNQIPVGSLEFVFSHMEAVFGESTVAQMPINIPTELRSVEYTLRNVEYSTSPLNFEGEKFVKSTEVYKGYVNIAEAYHVPVGSYLISDVIDIESEWRIFVYNRRLVGIHQYAGDFVKTPNLQALEKMTDQYRDCPNAYTLDVGVNERGTFVIEVHPFVSCGLYGFQDYRILPQMMIQGYSHLKRKSGYAI